jgi:hypothetical protein
MAPQPGMSDEQERHQEERNRKQREYHARRKVKETNEESEVRNKRMLDYPTRKKADTGTSCREFTSSYFFSY